MINSRPSRLVVARSALASTGLIAAALGLASPAMAHGIMEPALHQAITTLSTQTPTTAKATRTQHLSSPEFVRIHGFWVPI